MQSRERTQPDDVSGIVCAIERDLPELARQVIRDRLDLTQPENRDFLRHPDDREQHQTQWHQWGIITHTHVFLRDFDTIVPDMLRSWGLWELVETWLNDRIDGATKQQLLRISVLLHDIGKFGARRIGRHRFHFAGHEEVSRQIILHDLHLERFGLTRRQIAYVAETAGDHFVLGVVRKRTRDRGEYDERFVESREFEDICREIKREHPDDYVEIGLLFLGDSLAKAAPPDGPALALSQYDINIAVAHRYLDLVLTPSVADLA